MNFIAYNDRYRTVSHILKAITQPRVYPYLNDSTLREFK